MCVDENFADASMRMQAKYHDFREVMKVPGAQILPVVSPGQLQGDH